MTALFEGIGIALHSVRSNKVRAALTILGVAIGVMVVMVIASMVRGINSGVTDIFEQLGPRTFFVMREFEEGIQISDDNRRRRPRLSVQEAERIEQLPSTAFVVINEGSRRTVEFENRELTSVMIMGRGSKWPEVSGGDILPGRSFTLLEEKSNSRVVVVNEKVADELFGQRDPTGKRIKISGLPFEVIGVFNPPPDIFGEGNEPRVIIPHGTFAKHIRAFRSPWHFMATPAAGVSVAEAIEDVTATIRSMRGLRPGEDNNFDVVTQEKLLANWHKVTGMFFLVMIALSGVALMVGGVGVVAIMMISVTERTREIGVRKALGARQREIMWQFLVEAATLTLIGGALGMLAGGGLTQVAKWLLPLPVEVPFWSIVVALAAAALTGVGFGLYPAARAARLNPVEALRYE